MHRIALSGASSVVFTRIVVSDILLIPELQDSTIALMDIDPYRLSLARDLV
jgi:alpha-galactosidase